MQKYVQKIKCWLFISVIIIFGIVSRINSVCAKHILVEVKELVPHYKVLYLQMMDNKEIIKTIWYKAFIGTVAVSDAKAFLNCANGKIIHEENPLYGKLLTLADKKYELELELEVSDDISYEEIININSEMDLTQKSIFDILHTVIYG